MTKPPFIGIPSASTHTYNPQDWFFDIPVIGQLPAHRAVVKLRELGEIGEAEAIEAGIEQASTNVIGTFVEPFAHRAVVKLRELGEIGETEAIEASIEQASTNVIGTLVEPFAHRAVVKLRELGEIGEAEAIEVGIEQASTNVIGTFVEPFAHRAVVKLRELGEIGEAEAIEAGIEQASIGVQEAFFKPFWELPWTRDIKAWEHTSHAFGFIPVSSLNSKEPIEIMHAGNISADQSLKDSQIKITLDRLRVFEYPGSGVHHILCDFYAQNQIQGQTEHIHFNQIYRVQQGQHAGIIGYPIFNGLNVGKEGVAFKCFTVNIKNDQDEKLLRFLDSDVFKSGLKLATNANPAIAPLSSLAIGITKMFANRNKNVSVQDFYMGLDFTNVATRARLSEGSYIAVQIPEDLAWDWSQWVYNPTIGRIVSKQDYTYTIPYNYLVFSVSRYESA